MELFRLFGSIFIQSNQANQQLDEVDKKASGVGSTLGGLVEKAGKVALGFAAAGAAAVAGFAIKGVSASEELRKALNSVQASTGAADEEMDNLKGNMLNIYNNNFGESFDDIARSISTVKQQTGQTGVQLEKLTQNALMLRDTFEYEVNESTRAANSLMKNFGVTGEEAMNLIAQATQNGANKNDDLLDTFNEYSVQFKSLGFSAEQFANVLVDGAKNGAFSIDKVGDAIKEFNIRAKDGSDSSKAAFEQLGLDADKLTASFAKGGPEAQKSFQQVIQALDAVKDPVAQNTIGVSLFGTQFEDLEKQGVLAFANIGSQVSLSKSALEDINTVKYDTFGEALAGLGRNFEVGILIPLGEKILPILGVFSGWISSNMPAIQGAVEKAFNVISSVMDKVSIVVIPLLQTAFDNISNNTMPFLSEALSFITNTIMPPLIEIFNFVATSIVPLFAQKFKEWIPQVGQIMKGLWDIIKPVIDNIVKAFQIAWPLIRDIVSSSVKVIGDVISGVLKALKGVTDFVAGVFTGDWRRAWDGVKQIFSGVWDGIKGILKGAVNIIIDVVNSMIRGLNKIHVSIPDWIPGVGGKDFGINLAEIPHLAEGGNITKGGRVLVGEKAPEILDLPRGARVTPLDKANSGISITINDPIVTDDYGLDRLMDRITQRMGILGV
ncbi:phage tail tape measure protein [Pseudobacteroides cellulosolvens]|uniref:Tail tape measure protein n=1 Tax=Pseudobacteroides cellulosolvens ATCC 35603 = DSM 2933 TaxID=398512 RepID=A0A0L6JGK8_9FIRM|nr:phage tail tape measure protein [Pseudobacteroides cellulosolvens]KNY24848.1 tail tape measure protein [Pseudobacteroides cellulosolvens ATCC 35603 = DSM 2933]